MDTSDRRTYLKATGSAAAALALAGCTGGGSGDNGDGDGDSGSGGESGGDVTTITPGTAPGFPPFEMKESGELVGFDIDLLAAVVAEADGYELGSWQEYSFDSLIPALTSDKIDVVAAGMSINDDRDETIDFTDPYYNADQAILVRESGDFSPAELADLSGHKVGSQSGTTGETVSKNLVEEGTLKESSYNSYDSYVFAVQDLENGNIDAIILDLPVAQTFADQRPVSIAFTYETGERYGFGVREGDDDLQSALNEGLAAVRDSGQYEELRNEWFGGSDE
ncbi:polar amino acid transport system substrate-binding protein [Halarchaeum rubridurum]|uniref:Basic amino acid ABC transporter substrate-binding protein n=1 Tax=Halarchaeum rubridurum TaxID=489911 RepID=A0A830FXY3_9EURY|nr:basic amino acid ABC transporter substrate-binding protein [Halarchaeum rubridurum]MBP1953949.1 polar amino acid transport system substrate-binding protein [Halarchaeum rubridurum]GGM56128.1 basic amino acid ABC transporter substrate-binding protein [Halarchaeum rubridurum]